MFVFQTRNVWLRGAEAVLVFAASFLAEWFALNRHPGGIDWCYIGVLVTVSFLTGAILGMKQWWQGPVLWLSQIFLFHWVYPPDPLLPLGILLAGFIITIGWTAGMLVRAACK